MRACGNIIMDNLIAGRTSENSIINKHTSLKLIIIHI